MGYDIMAYFHVNQEEMEKYITDNNLDKKKYKDCDKISDYYKAKYLDNTPINILYYWNSSEQEHRIMSYYGINFIRDHMLFHNEEHQKELEQKYNRKFSPLFYCFFYHMRTPKDAQEIAEELSIFYQDDEDLMYFAKWLRETSDYAIRYDLGR